MKLQDINRKRLWILLTVLWCIGVVVYFYEPIKKEMKYNRIGTGERAAVLSTTFDKCLLDNGTNYLDLEQNNLEKCENKKQFCMNDETKRSWWRCNPKGLSYMNCVRNSSEECKHIYSDFFSYAPSESKYYDFFQSEAYKSYWVNGSWKRLSEALLLFFGIPLLFAVFPRIVSLLASFKRWLVSK
jgi:hypothetical protein